MDQIKLAVFDVDGVLTDGCLHYTEQGEYVKIFHAHDGLGLKLLQQAGVVVAVISGRDSAPLQKRLKDLGIQDCFLGSKDKVADLKTLADRYHISARNTAFMGDDLVDYHAMQEVGLRLAPFNAVEHIKQISHHVTKRCGGAGAVREAAEYILSELGIDILSLIDITEVKQ